MSAFKKHPTCGSLAARWEGREGIREVSQQLLVGKGGQCRDEWPHSAGEN